MPLMVCDESFVCTPNSAHCLTCGYVLTLSNPLLAPTPDTQIEVALNEDEQKILDLKKKNVTLSQVSDSAR